MGTETRVGILAGLVIVVVASVYFFYGSDRRDDEILVTSATRVGEQPKIPLSTDASKPVGKGSSGINPTASPARTPPPRRLADRLANRPPQTRAPENRSPAQPTQGPIVLADPSQPSPTTPPISLRTGPSTELVEATWDNLVKPGASSADPPAASIDRSASEPSTARSSAADVAPATMNGDSASGRLLPGSSQTPASVARTNDRTRAMPSRTAIPMPQPARTPEPTRHIIASGDTLSAIADRYYSDGRKADLILAANPSLKNPRNLKIGTQIIIPPIGDSVGQSGAKSSLGTDSLVSMDRSGGAQPVRNVESSGKTYTVQQGDTLYGISQRVYGAGSKWETILKHNRALLRGDPKRLAPGMVLQIP